MTGADYGTEGIPDETYGYDATGNRNSTGYSVTANNQLSAAPGVSDYDYDDEGNRSVQTNSDGSKVIYDWDHRNRLTTVTFTDTDGTTVLKTVTYVYDTSDLRVAKLVDSDGNSTIDVTERYVLEDGHVIVQLDGTGTVQHEYMHGPEIDQVFADENSVGQVLYPLTDNVGTVRDVATHTISTNVTTVPTGNHRTFDSFGLPLATITDGHAYAFTGREYDADVNLQYSRARWFDASVGKFISEDPIGFQAGDANVTRYVFNNPNNATDPTGQSILSRAVRKVTGAIRDAGEWLGDTIGGDVGDFLTQSWNATMDFVQDPIGTVSSAIAHIGHEISDAWDDTANFFEKQWENGNIQKALMVGSFIATLATGGAASGLMALARTVSIASQGVNLFETFSGKTIGDGTFSRVLGAAAAVTGGFSGGFTQVGKWAANTGSILGAADGLVSGYEIATGNTIGDGTLSSILNVSHIGVTAGSTAIGRDDALKGLDTRARLAAQAKAGLRVGASVGSVIDSDNPQLQAALRSVSIASSLWSTADNFNTGFEQLTPYTQRITGAIYNAGVTIGSAIYDAGAAFAGGVRNFFAPPPQPSGYVNVGNLPGDSPLQWGDRRSASFDFNIPQQGPGDIFSTIPGALTSDFGGHSESDLMAAIAMQDHIARRAVETVQYWDALIEQGLAIEEQGRFGPIYTLPVSPASYGFTEPFRVGDRTYFPDGRVTDSFVQADLFRSASPRLEVQTTLSDGLDAMSEDLFRFGTWQAKSLEQWAADNEFSVGGQEAVAFATGVIRQGSHMAGGMLGAAAHPDAAAIGMWNAAHDHVTTSIDYGKEHGGSAPNQAALTIFELTGLEGIEDWREGRNVEGRKLSFAESEQRGFDGMQTFVNSLDAAGTAHTAMSKTATVLVKLQKPNTLGSNLGNLLVPDGTPPTRPRSAAAAPDAKTTADVPQVSPQQRGRVSERRVLGDLGETKNTELLQTSQGNTIPDFQNERQVGEIKDTKSVSDTRQMRAQREAAEASGREHVVVTGTHTQVSEPLKQQSRVVRRNDLGPPEPQRK